MKEIGIPYSAPMILAKLAGRKTKTRRVVVPQPCSQDATTLEGAYDWSHDISTGRLVCLVAGDQCWEETQLKPPRGLVGDRQYWQEAFDFGGLGLDGDCRIRYKADGRVREMRLNEREYHLARAWKAPKPGKWRGMPAMYMLRSMSRGLDEVVGLRVERVQDISEEDAIAEGLDGAHPNGGIAWSSDQGRTWKSRPTLAYAQLWDSINGKRYPWESNPWVFVYETKRCQ